MKLTWDEAGSRLFETGISKAVLYPTDSYGNYTKGVAWSGLTSVTVSPEGAAPTSIYANNEKIAEEYSFIDFNGSIEAYTYPDEFSDCIGFDEVYPGTYYAMQKRKRFALVWCSKLGNDTQQLDHGYKLHILYGCMAQLSEMPYTTINESPECLNFSWSISTIPAPVSSGHLKTSYIEFNSTQANPINLNYLEQILFGTDWTDPRIVSPEELDEIMSYTLPDTLKGVYAILDNTRYPYTGTYSEFAIGAYKNYDVRKF